MYEEFLGHFGLRRNPFPVSPNPRSFYSTSAHNEALSQLVFGIETRQGLMVLTGEPGTGKTTILHYFLDWLQHTQSYSAAFISHTLLPSLDLLRLILKDFRIPCDAGSKGELLIALKMWLSERHKRGDCPVILIDEAQALTSAALEDVRLLLNLEVRGVKLVQIVLAGQILLEERLRGRELAKLRQRMMCHCQLPPLTLEETAGYIAKRLTWAGAEGPVPFAPETVQEIFKYSKGIPRVINLLCEHGLLSSYADGRNSVAPSDVMSVANEFELGGETGENKRPLRTNTFCPVVPFPELSPPDPEEGARQQEIATAVTAAQSEPKNEPASVPVVPAATIDERPSPLLLARSVSRSEPIVTKLASTASQLKLRFVLYWRTVGSTLAHDSHQFFGQCQEWLNKPNGSARAAAPPRRRVVRSVRSWLMSPSGSTPVTPRRSRTHNA